MDGAFFRKVTVSQFWGAACKGSGEIEDTILPQNNHTDRIEVRVLRFCWTHLPEPLCRQP